MSIRLRFTLLYNIILALTLAIFGLALYSIQAQVTLDALKKDILHTAQKVEGSVLETANGAGEKTPPAHEPHSPVPFQTFSNDHNLQSELEIVRVMDSAGNLVASPFGRVEDALPFSAAGLQAVQNKQAWWETGTVQDHAMLIYSQPVLSQDKVVYILQVARPLTERDNSLGSLATILMIASLITLLVAFGIGWVLSEITLRPIHRITQSAQEIGQERDFSRRVTYNGPQDEVGQLAATLNSMLERLQDAYQQVAHSLEMQQNFVADVSHELRTPLTTLRGNLGLLRRTPPIPPAEQTDILTDMVDESDRLIRLVNDLLAQARADAGRSLAKEPVALASVLEETCRQARQLDPQREITLDAEDLSVLGDRDALKQIMLIALDNALKHTSSSIAVSAHRSGPFAEIRVKDSGAGIAPEKLENIFRRFYRSEESTTIPGFGLGLPIAKSLVENQGGTIIIESELGKGSEVIIRFPNEF